MSCALVESPHGTLHWRRKRPRNALIYRLRRRLLTAERESRRAQARQMFARIACFPAMQTLDQ